MGAFGGLTITNKGIALQAKAQAGSELHYTRVAIGDGYLGGQSIATLTDLISEKKSLDITKLKVLGSGKAVIGAVLTNQNIVTGFYFREIGIFADDPDEGEILYAYANAGNNAEYIPPGGGPDVVEKHIDSIVVVGQTENVTATIDQSLVFATLEDLSDHRTAEVLDHPDGSVTTAKLADGAVTTPKIANGALTPEKLSQQYSTAVNAGYNEDPNTTEKAYILTNHANSPIGGTFWHIRTFFYNSTTGNRAQLAIRYSFASQVYTRFCSNDVWSNWIELPTAERPIFTEDIKLPNSKGLMAKDTSGVNQYLAIIDANDQAVFGDSQLQMVVRGTGVRFDGPVNINNQSLSNVNKINLRTYADSVISNGAITVNRTWHRVNTSGGYADLHTINGGVNNDLLILQLVTASNPVTIKHGVGNIETPDGLDLTLTSVRDLVFLVAVPVSGNPVWRVIASGVAPKRSGDNFTGLMGFKGGIDLKATTVPNPEMGRMYVDNTTGALKYRDQSGWQNIWHAGNDGAGSGLEADRVPRYSSGGALQDHVPFAIAHNTGITAGTSTVYYAVADAGNGRQKLRAGYADDADTVDGIQAERMVYGSNQRGSSAHSGDMNNVSKSGFYSAASSTANQPGSASGGLFIHSHHPTADSAFQLFQSGASRLFFRRLQNGTWNNWYEFWHSGNIPYETGTWTPQLQFEFSSSGITYSLRTGRYTRIGNLVYFTFRIALSSKGSANGDAYITGLPFTSMSGNEHAAFSIGLFSGITMPSNAYWIYGIIFNNSNQIRLRPSGDVPANVSLNATSFKNDTDIRAEGFYYIAA